ncbi:MAG: hypothetical protein LBM71_01650 [Elusimicrobiota bacterium]|jgi:3-hydroxyacyl-[acyl-carrier-protein] dehydratase|nr:hypothetical protein [Elusimicrobiota bacterium]
MSKITNAIEKIYRPNPQGAFFTFLQDFPAFEGHFPGYPLLPAVVQIELALFTISARQNKKVKLKSVKKAKFSAPIFPLDTVQLILEETDGLYNITIKKEESILSKFQITVSLCQE